MNGDPFATKTIILKGFRFYFYFVLASLGIFVFYNAFLAEEKNTTMSGTMLEKYELVQANKYVYLVGSLSNSSQSGLYVFDITEQTLLENPPIQFNRNSATSSPRYPATVFIEDYAEGSLPVFVDYSGSTPAHRTFDVTPGERYSMPRSIVTEDENVVTAYHWSELDSDESTVSDFNVTLYKPLQATSVTINDAYRPVLATQTGQVFMLRPNGVYTQSVNSNTAGELVVYKNFNSLNALLSVAQDGAMLVVSEVGGYGLEVYTRVGGRYEYTDTYRSESPIESVQVIGSGELLVLVTESTEQSDSLQIEFRENDFSMIESFTLPMSDQQGIEILKTQPLLENALII